MSLGNLGFRDLQYIVAVAENGTISRAAEACHVTQPALSERLKRIEAILETQLFRRTKTETQLTETGKLFVEHAREILGQVHIVDGALSQETPPMSGTLRVGAIATLGPYLMPLLLPELKQRYRSLSLILHEGLTENLLDLLETGNLDVVIAAAPLNRAGIRSDDLFYEPFVLAVPHENPLNEMNAIKSTDLKGSEMLLLGDGHCLSGQALSVCPAKHRKQKDTLHGMSVESLRQMVAVGMGYTLMPELSLTDNAPYSDIIDYRYLVDGEFGRTIVLATLNTPSRAPEFLILADLIKEVIPENYLLDS